MVRHIVWDWNGTLLDDTPATVRAAMAGLNAIGHPVDLTVESWREIATRPLHDIYERLVGSPLNLDQWKIVEDVWLETYVSSLSTVSLNPTALPALDEAASRGITSSIVSLHLETELRAHVEALGIADRFTHIRGSQDMGAGIRPSKADEVDGQLADLGIRPDEAAMIGDMADDGREGVEAGVHVVLVPTGDTSKRRLVASGFPVADSLLDAVRVVLG
ncbi:MAG: HAD hydrolase-like protein [Propionibacteriaceae bacterium]|jgi:phosphoglycolate phosphatase-like HAD superfamily hydrolase|nr:HAD hydrolase-like protein [Propionibacteriaceae bacterium]